MNDTTTQVLGGGTAVVAILAFLRWAVTMWVTVRREDIVTTATTATTAAAAARADGARMVEALLAQAKSNAELGGTIAKSNAELGGKIDRLTVKLDTLVEWRERTPVEGYPVPPIDETPSERMRRRATGSPGPGGYRPPKPGTHHDDD